MIRPGGGLESCGLGWAGAAGESGDIVVSSRVRLARNLQGYPFPMRASDEDRARVLATVRTALGELSAVPDIDFWEMEELDARQRDLLLERHIVSRELVGDGEEDVPSTELASHAALALWEDESAGVMVNEEDHLRLQSLTGGFELEETWRTVDRLDERLGELVAYAFHHEYGFLTACPTNVGTGLRASVLVHLPGLVLTQEIRKVLEGIGQVGLTYRGLYGEGSEVVGNLFQVSNQTTLGKAEEELVEHLTRVVSKVIDYERSARGRMLREAPGVLEDKVWRAYGILRHARSLSAEEMMNLLSALRLGLSLKLLKTPRVKTLNEILVFGQAAHLEEAAGGPLGEGETDAARAAYVRARLESDES
ncbi:MAG: protein arginine kinase [Gemmatimonadota bacterium]